MSGADKLKLADGPFTVSLVACDTLVATRTGPNSASYYPIQLRATVKSSLLATPFSIPPTPVVMTLVSQINGQDYVQLQGPISILGSTINVHGSIALPAGTLTSTSVAAFPSTPIVTSRSGFTYSQGDVSTTLSVIGTASASIYTGPPPANLQLHSDAVQMITAHADGSQTVQPFEGGIHLNSPSDQVMLRFYASGVRQAAQVRVQIAGQEVPVIYSGAAGHFQGLDEVTVEIPRSLAGVGEADVVLTVDGQPASPVRIQIQ